MKVFDIANKTNETIIIDHEDNPGHSEILDSNEIAEYKFCNLMKILNAEVKAIYVIDGGIINLEVY